MSYKIFLRDGKWYGNEFPEEPIWHLIPNSPNGDSIIGDYYATVEKLKSEAMEVVNPTFFEIYYDLADKEIELDVLYPWDGGWENEYYVSDVNDTSTWQIVSKELYEVAKVHPESGRSVKKVLRLLPKSPVTADSMVTHVMFKEGKFYGENALEIENPEELSGITTTITGCYLWQQEKQINIALKDGDTFPLPDTLEWTYHWVNPCIPAKKCIIADADNTNNCDQLHDHRCQRMYCVLRLKEKAVVKGSSSTLGVCVTCGAIEGQPHYASRGKATTASPSGIAAIGVPEYGEQTDYVPFDLRGLSPVNDAGGVRESQEDLFNEVFNRYSILLEGGYTGKDISSSLRGSFTITRKS
jgi:hypothetical protein